MSTQAARADFEEFVAVRSGRLLLTAYLLTGDRGLAEALLQTALAKAWVTWNRLDEQPEPFVRRRLVGSYLAPWRGRLRRRRRAVVVLRYFDDLSEEDTAELLGCSVGAVRNDAAKALAGDGYGVDEVRRRLADAADDVQQMPMQTRLSGVERRVAVSRRQQRSSTAVAVAGAVVAAVGVAAVGPGLVADGSGPELVTPSHEPDRFIEPPPSLVGHRLPRDLWVGGVEYEYVRSEEAPVGRDLLRVAVASSPQPQALAWVSPAGLKGQVLVKVDGDVVRRDTPGSFESGLLLSAGRTHLVVIRATAPTASMRLGMAIYQRERP